MSVPDGYASDRVLILTALVAATNRRVELTTIVGQSRTEAEALAAVQELLGTNEVAAHAVLDMSFRRLTEASRIRMAEELHELERQRGKHR